GGPGGPPPSRPPGAGLPPTAIRAPAVALEAENVTATRRAEIAEEEARLAALRTARQRLEEEVAALRLEAEERRRTVPGRKAVPDNLASGPGLPLPPTASGGTAVAIPAVTPPPAPPPPEPAPRGLRVFVHHRANSPPGAAAAEETAQALRGAGFEVTAVRAAPFVPSTPVVRYFHEEDQAAAARLAGRLGRGWAIQDFRAFLPQPPPQTLEVWLPAN
uniref:LytR C-terminal domain-containing protein n=1 Tax=Falsiroseomonas oryzae TaxID=2766473 RepID=UPI0038CBF759